MPIYVLHQAAIVFPGYWIVQLPLGIAAKFLLLLGTAYALTFGAYHLLVQPLQPMRVLFGMRSVASPRRRMRDVAIGTTAAAFVVLTSRRLGRGERQPGQSESPIWLRRHGRVWITKNLAVDGFGAGFMVFPSVATPPAFSRNAAIGNMDAGLFVISAGQIATEITVERNSFFGNGKRPQFPPANCGLVIQNQGAQPLTVNADGNWWGAASGPGGDPADAAGGACIAGTVTMNLAESATKKVRVKPPTK